MMDILIQASKQAKSDLGKTRLECDCHSIFFLCFRRLYSILLYVSMIGKLLVSICQKGKEHVSHEMRVREGIGV